MQFKPQKANLTMRAVLQISINLIHKGPSHRNWMVPRAIPILNKIPIWLPIKRH